MAESKPNEPDPHQEMNREIAERLRAEEALGRSERELVDFFENAPVGLHWIGPDGRILRVNRAEMEMLGYSSEEYLGHNIAEFHVDAEVIDDILRCLANDETIHNRHARLRAKDGSIRHVLISSNVYRENDEFRHTRCFTRDITEQKRTETERALLVAQLDQQSRRLATLVSSVPGVVWEAWGEPDVAGQRIDFVSEHVEAMLGYSVDDWLAKPNFWLSIVHPDDRERAAREAAVIFANCVGGVSEFRWVRRDGRAIWVESTSVVVCDDEGRPIGMRGVTTEVTSRKHAEQERDELLARERDARGQAEEANRSKDEFLATLSHELRTPLNAMLGWVRLLHSGTLDPKQQAHAVEVIERNVMAQAKLIDDVLDVSRIITGKLELDLRPVDLATVVEAAVDLVRPLAKTKEIEFEMMLDSSVGPVSGDSHRLQQIVWNLVSNALKFTPKGGRVRIVLERVDSHAQVSVVDTGVGIAPEFLPYVFDRFRQADATTIRRHGGLGLGLAIVRHLTDMHGGTISASSVGKDAGATFTMTLPLMPDGGDGCEGSETRARPSGDGDATSSDNPSLDGVRVLVVDDEADARDLISTILGRCGAEVATAATVRDALEVFDRWQPDVLVSDLGMPDEDGYVLIRSIRERAPERGGRTPAVALTAYAHLDDYSRALAAGFDAHISKPTEPARLIAVVVCLASHG